MSLYPETEPFESGLFDTGDGHRLYYERHGNPAGHPVVYLHGGPGAGCSFNEYRYFDPAHFNILLFDQRGAGKSQPYAAIENNSLSLLVSDLERMRAAFGLGRWSVCGGSFGSTLAMHYAVAYPQNVTRLLLRGVFFGDARGVRHITDPDGAAAREDNPLFHDYRNLVPAAVQGDGFLSAYYGLLTGADTARAIDAAARFDLWDTSIATFSLRQDWLDAIKGAPRDSLALSRLFFHYAVHEFGVDNRVTLLKSMADLRMPIDIIHGRQDRICPVENAVQLHQACPHARLTIAEQCGHAQAEAPLLEAFTAITARWVRDDAAARPECGLHPR